MSHFFVGVVYGVVSPPFVFLLIFLGRGLFPSFKAEKNFFGVLLAFVCVVGPTASFLVNTKGDTDIFIGTGVGALATYLFFWRKILSSLSPAEDYKNAHVPTVIADTPGKSAPDPIVATPTPDVKPVLAGAVSVLDDRQKDIENFGEDLYKATTEIASFIAYLEIFPKGRHRVDCGVSNTVVKETLGEDHLSGMVHVMVKVASQHVPPRPHITSESEVSEGDFVEDPDTLTPPSRIDLVMRFGQDLVDFWERVAQIECSRILREKAEYMALHPEVRSNKSLRKDGGPKFFVGDDLETAEDTRKRIREIEARAIRRPPPKTPERKAREKAQEDRLSALCAEHGVDVTDRNAASELVKKVIPESQHMQYLSFTDTL